MSSWSCPGPAPVSFAGRPPCALAARRSVRTLGMPVECRAATATCRDGGSRGHRGALMAWTSVCGRTHRGQCAGGRGCQHAVAVSTLTGRVGFLSAKTVPALGATASSPTATAVPRSSSSADDLRGWNGQRRRDAFRRRWSLPAEVAGRTVRAPRLPRARGGRVAVVLTPGSVPWPRRRQLPNRAAPCRARPWQMAE